MNVTIIGYCEKNKNEIIDLFKINGKDSISRLRGEFIIILETNEDIILISSWNGICQYYYILCGNCFFHGKTLIDVLKKSGIKWKWNYKALVDYAIFQHLIDNDTLHCDVYRMPPASIIHYKNGQMKLTNLNPNNTFLSKPVNILDSIDDFNEEVAYWADNNSYISMTAGFDSRVILSSFLKSGLKPKLITMGSPDCDDVKVSREIAKRFNLDISVQGINIDDLLKYGERISYLTSGTSFAWNWHSYIYLKKALLENNISLFIGNNGEFARTYLYDYGSKALCHDKKSEYYLKEYWEKTIKEGVLLFSEDEKKEMNQSFCQEMNEKSLTIKVNKFIKDCDNQLLNGLDKFYLYQRVKNMHSNGFQLYSDFDIRWRIPFLSRAWIDDIWNIDRRWKLGNQWHRNTIYKNFPELLKFPEEGVSGKMSKNSQFLYWHSIRKKIQNRLHPSIHFSDYNKWFNDGKIKEFLIDNRELLSDILNGKVVDKIISENKNGNRTATIAFLISMIFWKKNLIENKIY